MSYLYSLWLRYTQLRILRWDRVFIDWSKSSKKDHSRFICGFLKNFVNMSAYTSHDSSQKFSSGISQPWIFEINLLMLFSLVQRQNLIAKPHWLNYYNLFIFYCGRGTTSFTRRSCQTVLAAHLLSIVRVVAPILPHLAEDVWQHLPFHYATDDGNDAKFVFESRWPAMNETWLAFPVEEIDFWEKVLEVISNHTAFPLKITSWPDSGSPPQEKRKGKKL